MEKAEQVENLKNLQISLSKKYSCDRFVSQEPLSSSDMTVKFRSWLFEQLKAEISSNLSVLEAQFVTSNVLNEDDLLDDFFSFLNDLSSSVKEFCYSFRDLPLDQEGGTNEIS